MRYGLQDILKSYYTGAKIKDVEKMHKSVIEAKSLLIEDLGGEVAEVPFVSELTRKKNLLGLIKLRLTDNREHHAKFIDSLLELSDEAILSNRIDVPLPFENRTYQPGTKITKILTRLSGLYNFEKTIGMFAEPTTPISDINISIVPHDLLNAGLVGDSCYSPNGENQYLPFVHARSQYWAVAYDSTWTIRMYVLIDAERKVYGLNYTYPNQSNLLAYSVDEFLQGLGYARMEKYMDFFHYSDYYIDASYNAYPEILTGRTVKAKDFSTKIEKVNIHGIAEGTIGCAITGNPKYESMSFEYCHSCERIEHPDYMVGDYCESCANEDDDICWECDEYYWNCTCDDDDE